MPAYFNYLDENGDLNQVIDRFARGLSFTKADRKTLRRVANEKNPEDDRPRRLAKSLLNLDKNPHTTNDFPISEALRRLKARISGAP